MHIGSTVVVRLVPDEFHEIVGRDTSSTCETSSQHYVASASKPHLRTPTPPQQRSCGVVASRESRDTFQEPQAPDRGGYNILSVFPLTRDLFVFRQARFLTVTNTLTSGHMHLRVLSLPRVYRKRCRFHHCATHSSPTLITLQLDPIPSTSAVRTGSVKKKTQNSFLNNEKLKLTSHFRQSAGRSSDFISQPQAPVRLQQVSIPVAVRNFCSRDHDEARESRECDI